MLGENTAEEKEPTAMSERRVQRGAQFELITEPITLPNGRRVELDLLKHPGAAAVVPFLADGRVVLIRQYRFAAGGYLLEVPAGKLDAGEAPERCAARELEEETGYRAGRLEKLGSIWPSPGFTDEKIHLFAAYDLTLAQQRLESDEIIELVPMPFEAALAAVADGGIEDAKSGMALLLAAELRRRP
ncbi:MAG: NUDIX hydrolase [Myxococcota bacterium]